MTLGKHSLEKGYSTNRYNRQYLKNAAHKSKAQKIFRICSGALEFNKHLSGPKM